jgi:hypothetical protein
MIARSNAGGLHPVIVKFSTRFGVLTMHGEAAIALLRAMGHTGTVPGAILAADLPDALARLERVIEIAGDSNPTPAPPRADDDDEDERDREPVITLRKRALPLIDMLRTAIARDSDLMWERG